MGRTEKNILGKNAPIIIDLLKKAYCDEMQIFHYFWYIGINMEGIGLVTYAPALKTQATSELTHGELLSNSVMASYSHVNDDFLVEIEFLINNIHSANPFRFQNYLLPPYLFFLYDALNV